METYQRERQALGFLDCNLWMGRPPVPEFATGFGMASVQERLARYQIRGGVVSHFGAVYYGQMWGNEQVLRAVEGTGLWAGVVLVPETFRNEAEGRAALSEAIRRGARVARIYPVMHRFALREWCSGALLQAVADCHLPLMVRHTEVAWEEMRSLCETYPDLTVIVEAVDQKILYHNRRTYPLMERYPNFRLELHNFVGYLALEDVVAKFGARHLIYGSYMPLFDPNAGMMQVTDARISKEDKALIAHGNLLELVEGVQSL